MKSLILKATLIIIYNTSCNRLPSADFSYNNNNNSTPMISYFNSFVQFSIFIFWVTFRVWCALNHSFYTCSYFTLGNVNCILKWRDCFYCWPMMIFSMYFQKPFINLAIGMNMFESLKSNWNKVLNGSFP